MCPGWSSPSFGRVAHSLKEAPENIDPNLPFSDMGADSLILLEALQEINSRYGVSLTVLEIYETFNTIAKVARYVHDHGRAGAPRTEAQAAAAREGAPVRLAATAGGAERRQSIESIVRHQLELMERQLVLLGRGPGTGTASRLEAGGPPAGMPALHESEVGAGGP